MSSELSGAEVSALAEQRDFLLASLDDLEAEFAAGDIDAEDYDALKHDYTTRAASTIRAIEAGRARRRERSPLLTGRTMATVVVVLVAAGLIGVLLARTSGSRGLGDTGTGGVRRSTQSLLLDAQVAMGEGDFEQAIGFFDEVLELDPTEREALTYRGWLRYRTGDVDAAWPDFDAAVDAHPEYPDVRVFRAVGFLDDGDAEAAQAELDVLDSLESVAPVVETLLAQFRLRERIALSKVEQIVLRDDPVEFDASGLTLEELTLAAQQLADLDVARPADALAVIDYGLDASPDHVPLVALLGWVQALGWSSQLEQLGVDDQELADRAVEALDRAVELDPTYPDVRAYRAMLFTALERGDEATADIEVFLDAENPPVQLVQLLQSVGLLTS